MIRRHHVLLAVVLVAAFLPATASAQLTSSLVLDFTKGEGKRLFDLIYKLSFGLLFFTTLVALFLEFFKPPDEGPNLLRVGVRAIGLMVLLFVYPTVAMTVVKSTRGLADALAPTGPEMVNYLLQRKVMEDAVLRSTDGTLAAAAPAGSKAAAGGPDSFVGQAGDPIVLADQYSALKDSIPPRPTTPCPSGSDYQLVVTRTNGQASSIAWQCERTTDPSGLAAELLAAVRYGLTYATLSLLFIITNGARYIVDVLGSLLATVFYILGPLAIAASVPRAVGAAGAWFKNFFTYASYPVFTSLLTKLLIAVGMSAFQGSTTGADAYVNVIWTSLAFAIGMISVPMLASQLIGGSSGFLSAGVAGALKMGTRAALGAATAGGSEAAQVAAQTTAATLHANALMAHPQVAQLVQGLSALMPSSDAPASNGGGTSAAGASDITPPSSGSTSGSGTGSLSSTPTA